MGTTAHAVTAIPLVVPKVPGNTSRNLGYCSPPDYTAVRTYLSKDSAINPNFIAVRPQIY